MHITKTINRYTIVRLLGKGAMGMVYLAKDPTLERDVALKVVAIDPTVPLEAREAYLARFAAEAKVLARLEHPSIVQIYDTGEDNGEPWIAFQFVEGESLESILEKKRTLTLRRAMLFTMDIASALQHAHGWNIIHRDIKPGNILIEQKTGLAKLTDFGVAQAPWSASSDDGSMIGSPGYMSPEQIDGKIVDQRSDLFSLGILLYQMISGEHPFVRDTMAATINATCRGDYRPLGDLVPEIPKPLDAAIRRCLFVNIAMRMKSAAELVDVLRPLTSAAPGLSYSPGAHGSVLSNKSSAVFMGIMSVIKDICGRERILRRYKAAKKSLKRIFAEIALRNEIIDGKAVEEYTTFVQTGLRRNIGNRYSPMFSSPILKPPAQKSNTIPKSPEAGTTLIGPSSNTGNAGAFRRYGRPW
jgi:serine/threonine protein kinase